MAESSRHIVADVPIRPYFSKTLQRRYLQFWSILAKLTWQDNATDGVSALADSIYCLLFTCMEGGGLYISQERGLSCRCLSTKQGQCEKPPERVSNRVGGSRLFLFKPLVEQGGIIWTRQLMNIKIVGLNLNQNLQFYG